VPFTLPGEIVQARAVARRTGATVYEAETWLRESPDRAKPPCPHFGTCGGCAVQHLADQAYAAWKRGLLVDALGRAGLGEVPVGPLLRTPPGVRRRADFSLARGRDGTVAVGFHARRAQAVTDMQACPVLAPALLALVAPLRTLAAGLACLTRLGAAVINLLDHGADMLLHCEREPGPADRAKLAAFARAHHLARIAWGKGETIVQLAPPTLTLSGTRLAVPPGAFLQPSMAGEALIIAAVLQGLPARAKRIADLYAGLGTISLALPGRPDAFEGDPAAVAALHATGRARALKRDLARQPLQPEELAAYDAVVLDPPRVGAAEQVAAIAASRLRHVAYVSCAPASLARDARTLVDAGFRMVSATPIDQFLWSPHLETVAHFAR
jgi:23S rRNA (uracil1939-C5)-methyltransferase